MLSEIEKLDTEYSIDNIFLFLLVYPHLKSSLDPPTNNGSNATAPNATTSTPPVENNKK